MEQDCFVAEQFQQPAIDSKGQRNVALMWVTTRHDFTRGKMLNTTLARDSIYKFNDMKHHMDNHNAQYHREW
jgi:hypothetical protein